MASVERDPGRLGGGTGGIGAAGVADTVGDLVGTQAVLSPGDPLQAGRINETDKTTWLRGTWTNSMLRLVNDGTGPALELNTQPGVARRQPCQGEGSLLGWAR